MSRKSPRTHPDKPSWSYNSRYSPELTVEALGIVEKASELTGLRRGIIASVLIVAHSTADLREVVNSVLKDDQAARKAREKWK